MKGVLMVHADEERLVIEKKIERLKKRISNLNDAISLQANKIADTNTLIVISRDENILLNRIHKKKEALDQLNSFKHELIIANKIKM